MEAKDFLISKKTDIELILMENRLLVLGKCRQKNLVTQRDYLNLKKIVKANEEEHTIDFIDKIIGKGEGRCKDFVNLLQTDEEINDNLPNLKDILVNYSASPPNPAQDRIPRRDVAQKNRKQKRKMDSSNGVKSDNKKSKQGGRERYPLESIPTGLCFIINNMRFTKQSPRYGSDEDAVALAEVFSWLGFRVLMCEDQTTEQMDQVLKCLASASDITNLSGFGVKEWSGREFTDLQEVPAHGDAFICCILSHGNMGVVCGTDGGHLAIRDIKNIFLGSDLSPLKGKPKVFLIQACQGEEPHGRVVLPDLQSDDGQPASIPKECDMLFGIATVENYESYRHPALGSWYIQSVCKHLWSGCPRGLDMLKILTNVNKDVSKKEGATKKRPGVILKQMPEIRFCLRMDLVFSPPPN